jgi:hypothetical protein
MTTIDWLTLFKEIIAVYSENHIKPTNRLCGQNAELLNVKAGGTYSYQRVLKGQVKSHALRARRFPQTCTHHSPSRLNAWLVLPVIRLSTLLYHFTYIL